jgi:hypothetical protein
MPEQDLVDRPRLDAGVIEGLVGHPHHQALDGLGVQLAERGVGPAHDAGGHDVVP